MEYFAWPSVSCLKVRIAWTRWDKQMIYRNPLNCSRDFSPTHRRSPGRRFICSRSRTNWKITPQCIGWQARLGRNCPCQTPRNWCVCAPESPYLWLCPLGYPAAGLWSSGCALQSHKHKEFDGLFFRAWRQQCALVVSKAAHQLESNERCETERNVICIVRPAHIRSLVHRDSMRSILTFRSVTLEGSNTTMGIWTAASLASLAAQ